MSPARVPAETAASQLRRLLLLIPRLADGREHPIADVAAMAGVPPRALLADLRALVERYDVPAAWVNSVGISIEDDTVAMTRTDHFLRPMRLTMAELCALELGLMLVQSDGVVRDPAAVSGALGRLQATITRLPANDWQKGIRAAEASAAPATLAVIRDALRSRRKVRIRYRAGGDEAPTERTIAPHATALASGAWYVVAYCDRSEGLRFFRADRIEAADATEESIGEERVDVGALLASGRAFAASAAATMTVRYSPRIARWIAEREGHPLAADGSLTMEHPVADTDWAMRHVLQYGPDAEVVAPDAIREAIAERLDEMRRAVA